MGHSISRNGALAPSGAGPYVVGRRRLALGALSLAIVAAPLSMVALADGTASAVVDKGRDFVALMKDRSPGERTTAELTKAKKRKLAAAALPKQRALAKVVKPAPPTEFLEALSPQLAQLPPLVPFDVVPPLAIVPPGPGGPVVNPPGGPGGPIVFPPGGGNPPSVVPPPPPPAVPEPATWLSMLLGFGLLGSVCRFRRRAFARA